MARATPFTPSPTSSDFTSPMIALFSFAAGLKITLYHWVASRPLPLLVTLLAITLVVMSLSLKHIPCPAGNTCTAFHCIFGHEKDKDNGIDNAAQQPESSLSARHSPGSDEVPRKRQKLSQSGHAASPVADTEQSGSAVVTQKPVPRAPQTATRPVSPPSLKRPRPLTPNAKKVPATSSPRAKQAPQKKPSETLNPRLLKKPPASHDIRFKLLKMLFHEFTRLNAELKKDKGTDMEGLVLSEQDLICRALDEEQNLATTKASVYSNLMKNTVMKYKRMDTATWKTERSNEVSAARKQQQGATTSEEPKTIETGLSSIQEVHLLQRLLTPIESLSNHGYLAVLPTTESVEKAREGLQAAKGWEKCDRCQQRFQVFPGRREEDGALTSGGTCNFHWGKMYIPEKAPGDMTRVPKRYRCCGEELGESAGCFTRDHHVYKASDPKRLATVLNFAETPENTVAPADRGVCFDCEMCYTVHGLELIRLTATSWPTGEELLDVLVHPIGEILDLNSRYSGVWPEDMAQAVAWSADDSTLSKSGAESTSEDGEISSRTKKKPKIVSSPEVARDLLFSLLSPSTPLIGHGLENDLNAVRIVHPTLIDTVLLYPHRAGLPFRNGLKMLMDQKLNRKIQQDTGSEMLGHDSAEDARAAGELVRLRVAQEWKDMQRAGWRLADGEFIDPHEGEEGILTECFLES